MLLGRHGFYRGSSSIINRETPLDVTWRAAEGVSRVLKIFPLATYLGIVNGYMYFKYVEKRDHRNIANVKGRHHYIRYIVPTLRPTRNHQSVHNDYPTLLPAPLPPPFPASQDPITPHPPHRASRITREPNSVLDAIRGDERRRSERCNALIATIAIITLVAGVVESPAVDLPAPVMQVVQQPAAKVPTPWPKCLHGELPCDCVLLSALADGKVAGAGGLCGVGGGGGGE